MIWLSCVYTLSLVGLWLVSCLTGLVFDPSWFVVLSLLTTWSLAHIMCSLQEARIVLEVCADVKNSLKDGVGVVHIQTTSRPSYLEAAASDVSIQALYDPDFLSQEHIWSSLRTAQRPSWNGSTERGSWKMWAWLIRDYTIKRDPLDERFDWTNQVSFTLHSSGAEATPLNFVGGGGFTLSEETETLNFPILVEPRLMALQEYRVKRFHHWNMLFTKRFFDRLLGTVFWSFCVLILYAGSNWFKLLGDSSLLILDQFISGRQVVLFLMTAFIVLVPSSFWLARFLSAHVLLGTSTLDVPSYRRPNALDSGYKGYPYFQVAPCRLLTYFVLRIEANLASGSSRMRKRAPMFYQEVS